MTSVSWFTELTLADRPTVGGKGASLGELTQAGIDVPPGFVVRTEGFKAFIDHLERSGPMRARLAGADPDDLTAVEAICNDLMDRVRSEPLPESLQGAILSAYGQLVNEGAVAIRSSATSEDADDASFADQRMRRCASSVLGERAIRSMAKGMPSAAPASLMRA